MLKQSKTQISLIIALGFMVLGQVGYVVYENVASQPVVEQSLPSPEKTVAHAGSAKAFGLATPQEKQFQVTSIQELDQVFNKNEYTLTKAKSEGKVPRLYLAKLPKGMKYKQKSSNATFIQVLLPHILKVNEQILVDRMRLLELHQHQKERHLRHSEKMWLSKLASEYRCKSTRIESLLHHVDIVPPSLALAQAILETGGGRSHAALEKHSPFGYMKTRTEVQKFKSLQHSVEAYVKNLNRHMAYASFRKTRADLRKGNKDLCGVKLASCLLKYSVRGPAYTRDLQNLIRNFKLNSYDHITLEHMRLKP